MKWLLKILKIIGVLTAVLLLFLVFSVEPVEDASDEFLSAYDKSLNSIAEWDFEITKDTAQPFKIGWAKASIMPKQVSPMAGYRYRSAFQSVHDSLFCRAFVLKKGDIKAAMVTLDMLIFPPAVVAELKNKLQETTWQLDELYLSATHTHNGTGNWAKGAYGIFVSGGFDQDYVVSIAKAIAKAIENAEKSAQIGQMGIGSCEAPNFVRNRLIQEGLENSQLKWIRFAKESGAEAALISFTAHPTTISSKHHVISNDYPHFLEKYLLQNSHLEMAAFFAGPMGSHAPEGQKGGASDYFALPAKIGEGLAKKVLQDWNKADFFSPTSLSVDQVPIYLEDLHIRFLPKWRTRAWLFKALTEQQDLYIDVLQIDSLTFLSTPCDFSGELAIDINQSLSAQRKLMIHNFNGGYIGYITPDQYYHNISKPETMEMNWVGPKNGSYMSDLILKILDKTKP